jgi:hypothetical protein
LNYILVIGAALNFIAGLKLFSEIIFFPPLKSDPVEYISLKLFVVGVAFTFGSVYTYLFYNLEYIIPFLIFGAALKSWAFIVGLYLYFIKRIGLKMFIEFGVSNGIVAALFWLLIQYHS